jgi:Flp pilus assembly protein TadB
VKQKQVAIVTVTVAIVIGGVVATALITLMIVIIIAVTCRFAVYNINKRNNQGNRNVLTAYELTSNAAYHI